MGVGCIVKPVLSCECRCTLAEHECRREPSRCESAVAGASEGGEAVAVSWRSGDRPVFEFDTAVGATYTVSTLTSTPSRPKTDDTDSAAQPQEGSKRLRVARCASAATTGR